MKTLLLACCCVLTYLAQAQNPASVPKDSTLSMPERSFETLWQTFEDHYAFFALRKIDWHESYRLYRPRVDATTTDEQLLGIFSEMLQPFQDNHINVIIPSVRQFKSTKPSQFAKEFPNDSLVGAFWKMVDHTLARNGFGPTEYAGPEFNGKKLFAYAVSKKCGYLRFNRCFADQQAESVPDAEAAGRILDGVLAHFDAVDKMIVDVRDNIGGNDEFAYAIAKRFNDKRKIGMYKRTRKGGYEDFGSPETWYLEPRERHSKKHTVTLLTNDKTVSAGDVFALIMRELPRVKIYGTNTRGIYSDMYGFELPNKWLVSLSNQRYYSSDWICYEGTGTPVAVEIKNTVGDLRTDSDPVLVGALKR